MCDLDVRHVQLIESGNANPTVATLLRLARGLGVTLEALLERSSLAVQDVRAAALSDPNMTLTEVVEAYKPVMEIDALIAVRVKSLRLERDWSQSELAQRAGISQGAIQGIEARSKSPTLRTVDAIATAFSIPPHELLAPPARTTMPKARAGRKQAEPETSPRQRADTEVGPLCISGPPCHGCPFGYEGAAGPNPKGAAR